MRKIFSTTFISALMLSGFAMSGCETTDRMTTQSLSADAAILAAVNDPTRLEEQVKRDEGRKPAKIMALAGIKPGDKVGEIASGGGYYTALLSRTVGNEGHVYAVDPTLIFEAFPNAADGFQKYIAKDPRENVTYSVQRLDEFAVPETLDHIFMVLYYHDTLWTGEDRVKMNKAFFEALKPGGTYFIVDHDGVDGASSEAGKTLHRMDGDLVKPEVEAAGFEFVGSYDTLRNPADPLDVSVFDAEWRGKTDRFIYKYRKPFN